MMKTYFISPKAPLVSRSGRPFGTGVNGLEGADLPLPSSMAGAVRTYLGVQNKVDWKTQSSLEELKQVQVKGPFLGGRFGESGQTTLFVPRPSDAVFIEDSATGQVHVYRQVPVPHSDLVGSDFPLGLLPLQCQAAKADQPLVKGKPPAGLARHWPLPLLQKWLSHHLDYVELADAMAHTPTVDTRTHVAISTDTRAAEDGQLFQLSGLNFDTSQHGVNDVRLGLLFGSSANLDKGAISVGGERRLSIVESISSSEHGAVWPVPQPRDLEDILKAGGLRLVLLTPAIFELGWLPKLDQDGLWTPLPQHPDLKLNIRAVAQERAVPVSGWDMARNQPKSARKACAAGAVFWCALAGTPPAHAIEALWMAAISDHIQDRNDGFGVALPAPWQPL